MNDHKDIDWNEPTELYFLTADRFIKFGITNNWKLREQFYLKEELQFWKYKKIKSVQYDARWKAELIEQVMKWRLRKWCVEGRHEWIEYLSIQNVIDCFSQIVKELNPEINKYSHIHKMGSNRWGYYEEIAKYYFD